MFLQANELATYYPTAAKMDTADSTLYLARANAYALGVIGGIPEFTAQLPAEGVKTAAALAFEILAEGQTAQTDEVSGNVTEVAPSSPYARDRTKNPLETVDVMLRPYRDLFQRQSQEQSDNGVTWLGRA